MFKTPPPKSWHLIVDSWETFPDISSQFLTKGALCRLTLLARSDPCRSLLGTTQQAASASGPDGPTNAPPLRSQISPPPPHTHTAAGLACCDKSRAQKRRQVSRSQLFGGRWRFCCKHTEKCTVRPWRPHLVRAFIFSFIAGMLSRFRSVYTVHHAATAFS